MSTCTSCGLTDSHRLDCKGTCTSCGFYFISEGHIRNCKQAKLPGVTVTPTAPNAYAVNVHEGPQVTIKLTGLGSQADAYYLLSELASRIHGEHNGKFAMPNGVCEWSTKPSIAQITNSAIEEIHNLTEKPTAVSITKLKGLLLELQGRLGVK